MENLAVLDVLVPANIAEKLKAIESSGEKLDEEVRKEFSSKGNDE